LALASMAKPLDIPNARFYPDNDPAAIKVLARHVVERRQFHEARNALEPDNNNYLAISGGGDDGAFGAGLLVGWSERGNRPKFGVVTGISTGALSAPFVFLGSEYDAQLTKVYTETEADDVFTRRPLIIAALANDALADTAPLRAMIARFIDSRMISKIAAEYGKGRLLLVATTNLDQSRAVIWNIGAIAQSNDPRARDLIIDVLMASASIPGAFPPVMLNISINGQSFEEMHVDGGTIAQAFLYPPSVRIKRREDRDHHAYIIRNGRLFRPEGSVQRRTVNIAGQSIATMTAASGLNDTFRIFLTTNRDGVSFNLAYIDDDFRIPYRGPFDKGYMRQLYAHGYRLGRAGYNWHKTPPGYVE
jgi:predicted acylesterase/phospholipase RssA